MVIFQPIMLLEKWFTMTPTHTFSNEKNRNDPPLFFLQETIMIILLVENLLQNSQIWFSCPFWVSVSGRGDFFSGCWDHFLFRRELCPFPPSDSSVLRQTSSTIVTWIKCYCCLLVTELIKFSILFFVFFLLLQLNVSFVRSPRWLKCHII